MTPSLMNTELCAKAFAPTMVFYCTIILLSETKRLFHLIVWYQYQYTKTRTKKARTDNFLVTVYEP
jgi:hypothetical protein